VLIHNQQASKTQWYGQI